MGDRTVLAAGDESAAAFDRQRGVTVGHRRVFPVDGARDLAVLILPPKDPSPSTHSHRRQQPHDPQQLGEVLARAPAYVLRLALLYAVIDQADEIEPEHLAAGLAITKYSIDSARAIFGDHAGNDEPKLADALRDAGDDGLTRAQISKIFSGNKKADELDLLVGDLAERGYITSRRQAEGKGRPTTIFVWTNKRPSDPIGDLLGGNTGEDDGGKSA
jgi:hypothetical protein